MKNGYNIQSVRSRNRSLMLYLLNSNGKMSRKELALSLSLTPAAVTKISAELISEGFIKECGEISETGKTGRKEILLEANLSDKLAFGINAERDAVTFSVSDFSGRLYELRSIPFSADVSKVIEKGKTFLDDIKVNQTALTGVGVCTIGTNGDKDYAVWDKADIGKVFLDAFSLPVTVENNVKAFANAELLYGKKEDAQSVLFFKWGPGIGSAIAADGNVLSGNDNGVAEIGHYIVNPSGGHCRCGRYGCLETQASADVIIAEAGGQKSLKEIALSEDESIKNLLDHKIDTVSLALTNTATILNAQRIVLFGTMFENDRIADSLIKQCGRYNKNFDKSRISKSLLCSKGAYIGTTAICAKAFFFENSLIHDGRSDCYGS